MSTTVNTATEIRSFEIEVPEEQIDDLRRRIAATRLPSKELVEDRSQGVQLATIQELARYWSHRLRLRADRDEAERPAAVHDRDRRRGHPLHPRQVPARGRGAADHDPRLARLGCRAARDRRPAHRPDRARRKCRGRVPPRAAVHTRATASPASRARSAGTPAASRRRGPSSWPTSGYDPLRRARRRRRRRRHRCHGAPGRAEGLVGIHTNLLVTGLGADDPPARALPGGTRRARGARLLQDHWLRLLPGAGDASADDRLLAAGFTDRPGGVDARPRHGQLLQDLRVPSSTARRRAA